MTTHKVHVNLFHNQCLAIQTIVILLDLASQRGDENAIATYENATRWILPELLARYDDGPAVEETEAPAVAPFVHLPKVMIDYAERVDAMTSDEKTFVNKSERVSSDTLKGIGR